MSVFRQLMLALAFALASLMLPGQAQAQTSPASFNHDTTMFSLRGAHEIVRCETCHVNGVFKGTVRQCDICHAKGNKMGAVPMTVNHIPVTDTCDVCHNTSTFAGTQFTHAMVMPGTCNTCHNGYYAKGKSPSPPHPVTSASCDLCHSIGSFLNAIRFDHAASGIFAAPTHAGPACDSCHNGVRAEGKDPGHVPVPSSAACDDCHRQTAAWKPALFAHEAAGISSQPKLGPACSSCHNGTKYLGKPAGNAHIPTAQDCSLCHGTSPIVNPGGFALGQMDHTGITTNCASCHGYNSPYPPLAGKPVVTPNSYLSNHITVQGVACEACHSASMFDSFAGAVMNHSVVTGTSCATCHEDGTNFAGKTNSTLTVMRSTLGTHYPVPLNIACSVCHTSTTDFSQGIVYSPSGLHQAAVVNAGCASCHSDGSGPFAAKQSLVNLSATAGVSASGLPHIALNANVDCSSCHVAGTISSFNPGNNGFRLPIGITTPSLNSAQHAYVSTSCTTCHGGTTTSDSAARFAGIVASGASAGDTWPPASLDAAHQSYGNNCAGCHATTPTFLSNGAGNVKPAGHIPVGSLTCVTCHGAPASYTAPNLVATHTTGQACAVCHNSTQSSAAASLGTPLLRFNSDNGNHIPLLGNLANASAGAGTPTCDSAGCHANYSASGQSFVLGAGANPSQGQLNTPTLNTLGHNTVYAAGSTSCSSCHENGAGPYQGMLATNNTTSSRGDTRPTYGNHPTAAAGGDCSNCHSTTPMFNQNYSQNAQPAGHIPGGSATCLQCHTVANGSNFALPSVAATHSSQNQACSVCHNATVNAGITNHLAALSTTGYTPGLPLYNDTTHFPIGATDCAASGCHASYATSTVFTLARTASGSPSVAFAGHASVTSQTCVSCHQAGSNFKGMVTLATANPTDVVPSTDALHQNYTGDCGTCHTTSPLFMTNPITLPPNHIPTGTVGTKCTSCHVSGNYTTAAPVNLVTTHATGTAKCATCHDSSVAAGFLTDHAIVSQASVTNHIPFGTLDCVSCHNNYSAAAPNFKIGTGLASITTPTLNVAQHTLVAGAGLTTCGTCHTQPTGTVYYGMVASKVGGGDQFPSVTEDPSHQTYTGDCSACHTTTPTFVNNANGNAKPTGHIPTGTLACATCHGSPASYTAPNLVATHTTGLACAACHNGTQSSAAANLGTPVLRYNSDNGNHIPIGTLGSTTAAAGALTCNASGCHNNYTASGQNFILGSGATPTNAQITTPTLAVTGHNSVLAAGVTGCNTCHASSSLYQGMVATINTSATSGTAGDTRPTYNGHPTGTTDCGSCHSTTPTFKSSPSTSAQPAGHIPSGSAACSACHTAASGNNFGPPDIGLTHSSQSQACSVCHNATVSNAITANAAALGYGGTAAKPTVYNDTTHFPIGSTDCAASGCHSAYATSAVFTLSRTAAGSPSVAFAGHSSVTSQTCVSCHLAGANFKGMVTLASANPTDVFPSTDALHQSYTGDCGTCHTTTPLFMTNPSVLPPKHIPIGSVGVACTNCHVSGNYATSAPVNLVTTHTTGQTCLTCHASAVSGTFLTDTPIKNEASVAGHIPFGTADCAICHGNYTASVTNFKMNVTGTASITVPTLNVAQHAAVASAGQTTCSTCHTSATGTVYLGMLSTRVGGGDQVPSAAEDAAHPVVGGQDCSACHNTAPTFKTNASGGLPTNHIPLTAFPATPACTACHINSGTYVTARMNHSPSTGGVTSGCTTCHGVAGVALSFANVKPLPQPANHIPTTVGSIANACEKCHANAVTQNFNSFAGTVMNHSTITSGCITCHGVGKASAFYGVTMVVAPNAATDGHQYVASLACETCHNNTTVTGGFANGKFVHSTVSGTTCMSCHEITGNPGAKTFSGVPSIWMRNSKTHYYPGGSGGGPDCTTGCHQHSTNDKSLGTGTTAEPAAVLSATSVAFSSTAVSTAVTKTVQLNNPGTAALTLTSFVMSGTNSADFTQTNTCGTSLAAGGRCVITVSFKPAAAGNRTGTLTITDNAASKTQAITLTGAVATTTLSAANVVALSSTGIGVASPTQVLTFTNTSTAAVGVSSVAISGTNAADFKVASNTCSTTAQAAGSSCAITIGFTPTINTAQESALLTIADTGFPSAYVLQLVGSTGTQSAAAQQRRVSAGSQVLKGGLPASVAAVLGTPVTNGGSPMIGARGSFSAPPAAAVTGTGTTPATITPALRSTVVPSVLAAAITPVPAGGLYNHANVQPGQCFSCHDGGVHNGVKVDGKPANHIPSVNTCDTCHRTTSWVPALFNHSASAAGTPCTTCHNGRTSADSKPKNHFLTVRTCDTCHNTHSWLPAVYQHMSPRYSSQNPNLACNTCHVGNTEMVPLNASIRPNLGGTRGRTH